MLEQFSATIDKIYAAAADSARWSEALIAVEDLTCSTGAVVDLVPKGAAAGPKTLAGSFSEENCAEYARDYQAICPRIRYAMSNPAAGIIYDRMILSEAEMDRDATYEWFGRHGLRYFVGSQLGATQHHHIVWTLQRTRRQGHVDERDVLLVEQLKPHLARALSLADQLGTLRSNHRFSSAMFEAMPRAVFALGVDGQVLFANGRAGRLLALADGLRIDGGYLRLSIAVEQARLEAMIRSAIVPLGQRPSAWTRVSRPSGRTAYALFVAPLQIEPGDELSEMQARVLVLIHDSSDHRCADVPMLKSIYGLTEMEARLASALSGGHSVQSAAALLNIQQATARSHLKHVFRKLGVNRQQDLVRLLTSLSDIALPA